MIEHLQIYLLGEFKIVRSGEPVSAKEWHTRQARQLLKLLLTERGHTVSADRIIEALWPERGENAAKTLRSAINALRAVLEPDRPAHAPSRYIITRYAGYSFAPLEPASVWIDAAEFEQRLDECQSQPESPTGREKLARTLELYRGDYLSEDLYEEWATRERERLHERYLQGLEKLAGWQASAREFTVAIETCRRALASDNCREPIYRALMSYQAVIGDMAGALQTFERCRRTLDTELGADPSHQTLELHQALLNGGWGGYPSNGIKRSRAESDTSETGNNSLLLATRSSEPETRNPEPSNLHPLFIGREQEMAWLSERLLAAQTGQGSTVTLVGEAGIGKTYLAQRLLEQARQQGVKVLSLNCQAVEQALPFAPLVAALTPFLRQLPDEELNTLSPSSLAQVALLLPGLRERCPALPLTPDTVSEENRSRLINGLVDLFEEIAQRYTLALFCDDAQWADEATLLLINRLARLAEKSRLLLLLAYRSEDLSENETLHVMLRYLSRDRQAQPLLLQRFTPKEVACFVALQKNQSPLSAADLYQATQGNALFLTEALRTLTEDEPDTGLESGPREILSGPVQSPESSVRWLLRSPQIRDVVLARLGRLERNARRMLELAATIGRPFSPELLQVILPPEEWPALEVLLQRRFLVQQSDGRLAFSHEVVREVVNSECAPLNRHLWHRKVGEGLSRLYGGSPEPYAAEMVFHYKRAGAGSEAVLLHYAVIAGDYSRRTFSYRHARTYYDDALTAARQLDPESTRSDKVRGWIGRAYQGRGLACEALLDWEGVKETYRSLSEWAAAGGDLELAETCERRIALIRALMGHLEDAASLSLAYATNALRRSGGHTPLALQDLLSRSQAVMLPPDEEVPSPESSPPGTLSGPVQCTASSHPSSEDLLHPSSFTLHPSPWPPFCVAAPVPGEPWKELPEMLGVAQSALLLFQYGWTLVLQGRPEAEACLEAAIAASEETDQVACWVLVALQLSHLYFLRGQRVEGEDWLKRCLERGQQAPEVDWTTLWPRIFLAYTILGNGDYERALRHFSRLQDELATRPDFYSHRYAVEIGLGLVARRTGDRARAIELLQTALNARTRLYGDTYVVAVHAMAGLAYEQGDLEAARQQLRQCLAFCGQRSQLQSYIQTSLEIARLELRAGGNLESVEALLRNACLLAEEAGYNSSHHNLELVLAEVQAVATTGS